MGNSFKGLRNTAVALGMSFLASCASTTDVNEKADCPAQEPEHSECEKARNDPHAKPDHPNAPFTPPIKTFKNNTTDDEHTVEMDTLGIE